MPTTTTRLSLTQPIGADPVSQIRVSMTNNAATLDRAVLESSGTLVARPAAGTVGNAYRATDTKTWSLDNSTSWDQLLTLGGTYGPLKVTDLAAPATLVAGTAYVVTTGAGILTLPSPLASTTITVLNQASNVTIRTLSGRIFGPGFYVGATSFPLAAGSAGVVLIADGSNWFVAAGQQDTGIISLNAHAPFTSSLFARLVGDRVWFSGFATALSPASGLVADLPSSSFAPSVQRNFIVWSGGSGAALASVAATPATQLTLSSVAAGAVYFDGCSYLI